MERKNNNEIFAHLEQTLRVNASKNKCPEIKNIIARYEVNLDAQDGRGATALHWAAVRRSADALKLLCEKGADVNVRNNDGETPLHIAARNGYTEIMRELLSYDADPNTCNAFGFTPTYSATSFGYKDAVRILAIDARADVNKRDKGGRAPLHIAAQKGFIVLTAILLENGADITAVDKAGYTPFFVACCNGSAKVARLLQTPKVLNKPTLSGETPLQTAASKGFAHVVNMLLEMGANVNKANKNKFTPLHWT